MKRCGPLTLTAERRLDEDWAIKIVGSSNREAGEETRVLQDYDGACLGVSKVNMISREPAVWSYY